MKRLQDGTKSVTLLLVHLVGAQGGFSRSEGCGLHPKPCCEPCQKIQNCEIINVEFNIKILWCMVVHAFSCQKKRHEQPCTTIS